MARKPNTRKILSIAGNKSELEVIKLQKEIEQLDRATKKWYKDPQWILALSPIFVGIFTLIVAWQTGFLQAQSTLNEIQRREFIEEKKSMDIKISQLKNTSDSLQVDNEIAENLNVILKRRYGQLLAAQDTLMNLLIPNSSNLNSEAKKYLNSNERFNSLKKKYCEELSMSIYKKILRANREILAYLTTDSVEVGSSYKNYKSFQRKQSKKM